MYLVKCHCAAQTHPETRSIYNIIKFMPIGFYKYLCVLFGVKYFAVSSIYIVKCRCAAIYAYSQTQQMHAK